MEKIHLPLLCYKIRPNAVLGMVVGTDIQVVEKGPKQVKSLLSEHLSKLLKKQEDVSLPRIKKPQLKMLDVWFRPTYHLRDQVFPLSWQVKIETPLVFGEEEEGVLACYLPMVSESFYCYDLKQLEAVAKNFFSNSLDRELPEGICRLMHYPKPSLETITLPWKEPEIYSAGRSLHQKFPMLERLAERFPSEKSIHRRQNVFPDAAWELEHLSESLADALLARRVSMLLVGNPGVGKTAVLRQALRKITSEGKKKGWEIACWRMQAQRFTSTSKYVGEWQETVEKLVWELTVSNGILWIENILQLLREGGSSPEDSVAAYLLPFIQQGRLQIVGEVTPSQLETMRRLLPGFIESIQVVDIPDLPEGTIQIILEKFTDFARQNLGVKITREALALSLRLLKRFYPYESFPGKGIRFLSECINEARLNEQKEINRQDVIARFKFRTGLPELFLRDDWLLDQEELRSFFSRRIIGQEEAVERLCDIVKVFKAGLNNPHKPITTLIFAGPTGVGKTASAQALAAFFFGTGQRKFPLIRIDMSEFQHPSQISRFIGAGGEPGRVAAEVRERPFSVLLLDEAEKADPAIFDAFLSVLDEGIMADAFGRQTNFRNCIIILTTNLGAGNRRSIGFGDRSGEGEQIYRTSIARFFRPEFINRIDGVVIFQPLRQEDIRKITRKELEELKQREGILKKNINLNFTENVVEFLAGTGFDERYGARPLQRALEDHVVKPLAAWLLKNPLVLNCELEVDFFNKILLRKK